MRTIVSFLIVLLSVGSIAAQCFDENLTVNKPVEASSFFENNFPSRINDGNENSLWVSEATEPQWVQIDLGIVSNICALTLKFGLNYPIDYEVEVSEDGENWQSILSVMGNDIQDALYEDLGASGRYLRLSCLSRPDPEKGFEVYELTAFGNISAPYQYLTFPALADRRSTDAPFALEAFASSGLPVSFTILSGPATVDGNVLSLTGEGGIVSVEASQPGNGEFNPAEAVVQSFEAIDPAAVFPVLAIGNPSPLYPVAMPELGQITLSARAVIDYPQWFSIESATFQIDGETLSPVTGRDGAFYLPWTPDSYGAHTFAVMVTASNGNQDSEEVTFEIVTEGEDLPLSTFFQDEVIAFVNPTYIESFHLPTQLGAYDRITATLSIGCPGIGCDAWDRLAHIDVRAPNGEWVEFIRYITPFGVPCTHTIDVTDYASLLQGNVELRVRIGTFQRGWAVSLDLEYEAGQPEYRYSKIENLWYGYHPFGEPANLQPADTFQVAFPPGVLAAKLHLVGTGHGWGENNTGNAAEFFQATHWVRINDQNTFEHHNWRECNPNPDGCQPQNGTWYFDRAGWCPGAISPWYEYDMAAYIDAGPVELTYRLFPQYVDLCHPNNPGCLQGLTCPNCNAGFNPHLVMATNLITYSNAPLVESVITAATEASLLTDRHFRVFPNPSDGVFQLEAEDVNQLKGIRVYDLTSRMVLSADFSNGWSGQYYLIDLSGEAAGMYLLEVLTTDGAGVEKLILR